MFIEGMILRYGERPTDLFRVERVESTGARHAYFGPHCMGGQYAAYHDDCERANVEDKTIWRNAAHWRSS